MVLLRRQIFRPARQFWFGGNANKIQDISGKPVYITEPEIAVAARNVGSFIGLAILSNWQPKVSAT